MVFLLRFFMFFLKKKTGRVLLHHLSQNLQGVGPLLCFGQSCNNGTITWHLRTRLQEKWPTKKNGFFGKVCLQVDSKTPKKKRCEKTSGFCVVLLIFFVGVLLWYVFWEILSSKVDAHFQNVVSSSLSSKNKDTPKIGPKKSFGK